MSNVANLPGIAQERKCRVCGCTDHVACVDELGGTCYWVDHDLCSECMQWKRITRSGPLVELPGEVLFEDDEPSVLLASDADLNAIIAEHRQMYGGVYVG